MRKKTKTTQDVCQCGRNYREPGEKDVCLLCNRPFKGSGDRNSSHKEEVKESIIIRWDKFIVG